MRLKISNKLILLTLILVAFDLLNLHAATTTTPSSKPLLATDVAHEDACLGWEKVSDSEGIVTCRKSIPDSAMVAFKGQTVMASTIGKIITVLGDTSRKKEWVARIVEAKNIQEISQFERIEYNQTASPTWPIKNRDFVFHAKLDFSKSPKTVVLKLKSVEDSRMPERDCCIRGVLHESVYTMTDLGNGKTLLSVEIHADPKGMLPAVIVNLFQKSWPRKTLEGIRKQLERTDIVESPELVAALNANQSSTESKSASNTEISTKKTVKE